MSECNYIYYYYLIKFIFILVFHKTHWFDGIIFFRLINTDSIRGINPFILSEDDVNEKWIKFEIWDKILYKCSADVIF